MAASPQKMSQQDWAKVIAEAWLNDDFKQALEKNPVQAIRDRFGLEADRVLEVPPRPTDLSEEDLKEIAGGARKLHILAPKALC